MSAPTAEVEERTPTDSVRPTTELRLSCLGVPEEALERLRRSGAHVVDSGKVDAVVVSTRLSRAAVREVSDRSGNDGCHTIVLAHTGAERLATELVRAGADSIVGEGNEEALLGLVDSSRTPTALLASFERRFGAAGGSGQGVDSETGLPDNGAFERRLGTLADADQTPRIAYLKVISERWKAASTDAVVVAQRRRLGVTLAHLCAPSGAELFASGTGEFALLAPGLTPADAEALGGRCLAAAATFSDRGMPLPLVVGHAGPESAVEGEQLIELARRAVEVAAVDGTRPILGGADLARGVSVTTELEAVVRLLDEVEPTLPEGRGHGERVGRVAAELARLSTISATGVWRIHLAGHLHDVGRVGLPVVDEADEDLDPEQRAVFESFPARSADLLRLTAGSAVAQTVRAQRERFSGGGFPDRLQGAEIPEGARILAVAHAIDQAAVLGRHGGVGPIARRLQQAAGEDLDPDVVDRAVDHLPELLVVRG